MVYVLNRIFYDLNFVYIWFIEMKETFVSLLERNRLKIKYAFLCKLETDQKSQKVKNQKILVVIFLG